MNLFSRVTVFTLCMITALAGMAQTPTTGLTLDSVKKAPSEIVPTDGFSAKELKLDLQWEGSVCRATLANKGRDAVRVREIVLARIAHSYPPETGYYGEGFTMLSQTGGTLGKPVDIGGYTDRSHYKIPQPADALTAYGMFTLLPTGGNIVTMGFSSCRRFVGKFYIREKSMEAVVDAENLELAPGESWTLEDLWFGAGSDREALLAELGDLIKKNHPPICKPPVPTGWCSWYCFGPMVSAKQVERNLDFIAKNMPELRYVQIDDGYQAAMGDWLETGKAFKGGIRDVLKKIQDAKLEPAIWVAPFIAEENSRVFQEHPDWFIMDADGKPLRSDKVTFGGWRNGPWYAVDGTHPEAQKHLEQVFRTMREEWGCTYFKLDANFWGAMHGGRFHDPKATRVEAYRRGMEAVLRGAGDSFVLGCNHPLWPSLGVVHGARSSGDTGRGWDTFRGTTRETFHRNWQNGRFWWNDPDCVLLYGDKKLTDAEFSFHATAIYAAGGMTLSGDDLPRLSPERLAMLRKLVPPTGVPARFDDDTFRIGRVSLADRTMICVFNWDDTPQNVSVRLPKKVRVSDYWMGGDLGEQEGSLELKGMAPHSGCLLECTE